MNYHIEYELNGQIKGETFDAHDVGQAYAKCLKKHQGCTLVKGHVHRRVPGGGEFWMHYEVPSLKTPEPLQVENLVPMEMELGDPRRPKRRRGE